MALFSEEPKVVRQPLQELSSYISPMGGPGSRTDSALPDNSLCCASLLRYGPPLRVTGALKSAPHTSRVLIVMIKNTADRRLCTRHHGFQESQLWGAVKSELFPGQEGCPLHCIQQHLKHVTSLVNFGQMTKLCMAPQLSGKFGASHD